MSDKVSLFNSAEKLEIMTGIEEWLQIRLASLEQGRDYGSQKMAEATRNLLEELNEARFTYGELPWETLRRENNDR